MFRMIAHLSTVVTLIFIGSALVKAAYFTYFLGWDAAWIGHMPDALFSAFFVMQWQGHYVLLLAACGNSVWIYAANRAALGTWGRPTAHTPGWVVAYSFLPIVQIWAPFLMMRRLWNLTVRPEGPFDSPASGLFRLWWLTWLAAFGLYQPILEAHASADWEATYLDFATFSILQGVLEMAAGVAFLRIQWAISRALDGRGQAPGGTRMPA